MQKLLRILLTLALILGNSCLSASTAPAWATSCDDVQFIFARGSGEALGDVSEQSWRENIEAKVQGSELKYSFYELGTAPQNGAQYPAVAVSGSTAALGHLVGAYVSAGQSFEFGKSVLRGRNELKAYLSKVAATCPTTKFVLGGYSQGAMLITGMLDEIDANKIIYIATFGDPKSYYPEGKGNRPDACYGRNLSDYRAYVSDCHAYEGVLGSYRPYQPSAYLGKLGAWCNGQDIMCSSGLQTSDHTAYVARGLYHNATNIIAQKLQQAWPEKFAPEQTISPADTSPHDMAILLHGGNSDALVIVQYKLAVSRLANQVFSLGGRVALYYYGDYVKSKYIRLCDFSCTAEEFNTQLGRITHLYSAVDEFNSGLQTAYHAMEELEWQIGATKSLVLLTRRAYTPVDRYGLTVQDVAELSLTIDPVNIYPITEASELESVTPLATATNGKAYTIDQHQLAVAEITGRPAAYLALESYEGAVGETFTFDATTPQELPSTNIVRYDWDLDADGVFELQGAPAVVEKRYDAPKTGFIQVRVTDVNGYSSTMSARLVVSNQTSITPTISNLAVEQEYPTAYVLTFATNADNVLVTVNDVLVGRLTTYAGQNTLRIDEVTSQTTVRLVPYGQSGRGEAASITFGPETKLEPDGSSASSSESSPNPAPTPVPSAPSLPIKRPAQNLVTETEKFIPTAPNTGVNPEN